MLRLLLPLLLFASSLNAAGIQKWIDESGQVHYGDSPPTQVNTESVRISRPPTNPGPPLPRLRNENPTQAEADTPDPEQAQPDSNIPQPTPDQAAEFCEQARKDLNVLNNSQRIRLRSTDGGSRFMTDEERETRKEQTQADIDRYCR
jgi:hypothetical protein